VLWGEQYDRKMSDLLSVQREIAITITQKLQLKLSGNEKGLTKKYTNSNEAYQLYLRGRHSFAKRTKDDISRAIEYFQQAIKLDPEFALAYARISEAYGSMPAYPYLSPGEAFPKAKAAAQQALEIDPTLAEDHTFLAYSLVIYHWNWTESERSFNHNEAISMTEEWLRADPINQFALREAGVAYAKANRRDKAEEMIRRLRDLAKTQYVPTARFAAIYAALGDKDKAFEELNKAFAERDWELFRFNADAYWIPLRADPRYAALVKRLNLPQ